MKITTKRFIAFTHVADSAHRQKLPLLSAFQRVISSGIFLNGPENKRLTKMLQHRLGGSVQLLASGHDALLLALKSLHLAPTDEVIFPVNSYPTAFPIALSGATPVAVDIDANDQLDPQAVAQAITKRTKAIVLVHLYGLLGDIETIKKLAKKHSLLLIEDAAQAFGTTYKGKPAGTLGDIGCFSFYPTKNLGALGDGGALWTKRKNVFTYVTMASQYGEKDKYHSMFIAGHSTLPELQATALSVYLKNDVIGAAQRKKVDAWYTKALRSPQIARYVSVPTAIVGSSVCRHMFVIHAEKRDKLRAYLTRHGIPTHIHYPTPIHLTHAFSYLGLGKGQFPVAEKAAHTLISLPFHPYLRASDVIHITNTIANFYA